jgi:MYXO-CTERM domain-containing protein
VVPADCDADEICSTDGICVPTGGGDCTDAGDCVDLVCRNDTCGLCTFGSDECGSGRRFAPDGRCVVDTGTGAGGAGGGGDGLMPGDNVQGGALTCALSAEGDGPWLALVLVAGAGALAARRKRRND